MEKCPRCGSEVENLHPVPADALAALQGAGEVAHASLCAGCISEARGLAAGPPVTAAAADAEESTLLSSERAKDQHRVKMWKSRVQLIKKARILMNDRAYSQAAVAYEKYLKILELVFGCKKGEQLTPDMFKESARTSELTVVVSVYWDLLRIYDTSKAYSDRQDIAARQLAKFVPFTPIFPDIIKKAEAFARQAKNPGKIKSFIRAASKQRSRCFIATAAFESPQAPEVRRLRLWREQHLRPSPVGRGFILFYNRHSPPIARFLDRHPRLKPVVRAGLRCFVWCIR